MDSLLVFLEEYYIWFLVAGIILLFALIGFIVDSKRKKKKAEGELASSEGMQMGDAFVNNTSTGDMMTESTIVDQNNTLGMNNNLNANVQEQAPTMNNASIVDNNTQMNTITLDSNNMNFNDIAMPEVNNAPATSTSLNQTSPEQNTEIIEGFNVGNPVSVDNTNNNVQSAPEIVSEPAISVSEKQEVTPTPNIFDQPTVAPATAQVQQPQPLVAEEPVVTQTASAAAPTQPSVSPTESQNQEIIEIN